MFLFCILISKLLIVFGFLFWNLQICMFFNGVHFEKIDNFSMNMLCLVKLIFFLLLNKITIKILWFTSPIDF